MWGNLVVDDPAQQSRPPLRRRCVGGVQVCAGCGSIDGVMVMVPWKTSIH